MKSDKQIKGEATIAMKAAVFIDMNEPKDIIAHCSDGVHERRLWKTASGSFGWYNWIKVSC